MAVEKSYTASVWREGSWFVAQCLEVDVASQGETEEEAIANLAEALQLHFEKPRATATPRIHQIKVGISAA